METCTISRACSVCGYQDGITISNREAAFELVDINNLLGRTCRKCNSKMIITAYQTPDLDYELIEEWATNTELYLMQQDEELLLAEEKHLDNILYILDTVSIPDYKRDVLLEALCIIIYDNTHQDNVHKDSELKDKVVAALNKRLDKLKLAESWISDYIKDIVFPQLNLK